jgi:hypothetical protein
LERENLVEDLPSEMTMMKCEKGALSEEKGETEASVKLKGGSDQDERKRSVNTATRHFTMIDWNTKLPLRFVSTFLQIEELLLERIEHPYSHLMSAPPTPAPRTWKPLDDKKIQCLACCHRLHSPFACFDLSCFL